LVSRFPDPMAYHMFSQSKNKISYNLSITNQPSAAMLYPLISIFLLRIQINPNQVTIVTHQPIS